jgi:hypothetical protein
VNMDFGYMSFPRELQEALEAEHSYRQSIASTLDMLPQIEAGRLTERTVELQQHCEVCGTLIHTMCFRGTGVCCTICEKARTEKEQHGR